MEEAQFDDITGEALNDEARRLVSEAARDRMAASASSAPGRQGGVLDSVATVEIAPGTWKYVQIQVTAAGESKRIVRSYAGLKYHAENYDRAMRELRRRGIAGQVIGGGRIKWDPNSHEAAVYGYSKTFGRSPGCNELTAQLIEEHVQCAKVTWTDSGY
mmetsp:Transcript_28081/g.82255  ORF Transcript_28081/g.82255 Transcript_28081/m.82255 type:complete len:159 (-) Transcript_28081:547-1023(-)